MTAKLTSLLLTAAILFGMTISVSAADGQPRKRRAKTRKTAKTTTVKPKPVANASGMMTTSSGLAYIVTRTGTGRQPRVGETVVVHYTGLLGSGVKFDSSLDHPGGQPFTFKLGVGRVIKGWDEGIAKLHVGDQATLIITPELAYGEQGHPPQIPPNSVLIFIVELIGIEEDRASN